MKILFTGGFTLGPVTPLLAIAEELKRLTSYVLRPTELLWIGTRKGPERQLVKEAEITYQWIWAPKWRRYFDLRNLFTPLALHVATKIAWFKLLKINPDLIVTAGGFVGVPVAWAGWWLRIPVVLHNQDVRFSIANKLVAPFARKITYALADTVPKRWEKKAVWTGNPVRSFVFTGNKDRGLKLCGFDDIGRPSLRVDTEARPPAIPTILVVGGGTGAKRLNDIVVKALPELTKKYQIIHITGKGKGPPLNLPRWPSGEKEGVVRYCAFEFVTSEIADLYAVANLVITRAGMGVLTELAALCKPMIIVPIPESHQEDNARYFEKRKAAAVLDQRKLNAEQLIGTIERLLRDLGDTQGMIERAHEVVGSDAAGKVASEILNLVNKKHERDRGPRFWYIG